MGLVIAGQKRFTEQEIKDLLDTAKQTKKVNDELFEIKLEARQIKMILVQKFGITNL